MVSTCHNIILQYLYCIFDQTNAALVEISDFFQKLTFLKTAFCYKKKFGLRSMFRLKKVILFS